MAQPVVYSTAGVYIESKLTVGEKIIAIESIISLLLVQAAENAGVDGIQEYQLDDGQSKIKTIYRGSASIMKAIEAFEKLKQYYINKLNGRVFRLSDKTNFR